MLRPLITGAVSGSAITAVILVATTARAGFKEPATGGIVKIDEMKRQASGTVAGARGSDDSKQFIGCYATSNASFNKHTNAYDTTSSGGCQSSDATGKVGYCTFGHTVSGAANHMLVVAAAAGPGSHIAFEWDEKKRCTSVSINNSSKYMPETDALRRTTRP